MARKRTKHRTHVPVNHGATGPGKAGSSNRPPKSMVIRMGAGEVGSSISQLVKDFRAMMEPDTASRLKERKSNKLKDYTSMAGPLGVTHLFLFSRSKSGNTNLRIALTPRGPTLHFQIEKYSLCRDVAAAQKHPRMGGKEYLTPPLLVMNNFASPPSELEADPIKKQLESLTTTIFQSIFPPIAPQTTPLSSIKRILLLNREVGQGGTYVLSLRHYAITTKRTGVSKRVRRFDTAEQRLREKKGSAIPNLSKLDDVADYLLDPSAAGYTSASETELDTDAEVEVLETTAKKVLSKREFQKQRARVLPDGGDDRAPEEKRHNVEKRAVKLVELGPRMRLRMVKVEEGLCEGRVMWNEFVSKTAAEEKELEKKWEVRRRMKEERRKVQKENVERKKLVKANTKANSGADGRGERNGEYGEEDDDDDDEDDDEEEDDYEDFDDDLEDEDGEEDGEQDADGADDAMEE